MPKQIQDYRVSQQLVRLFGLKGRYQPVLDETIVPVIDVGREAVRRLAAAGGAFGSVAAEFSYFQLKNLDSTIPAERVNLVITHVNVVVGAATQVILVVPSPLITLGTNTLAGTQWLDTSMPGSPHGICSYGTHAAAVPAGSEQWKVGTSLRDGIDQDMEIIVTPGWTVNFFATTANSLTTTFGLEWYEQEITQG